MLPVSFSIPATSNHSCVYLNTCCFAAGTKADSVPGQWSYTVGPCPGIQLGDQLWMSRYLLLRVSEKFNLVASMDPKPAPGDWGGSGATVKFSTRETRQEGKGWFAIQGHVNRLQVSILTFSVPVVCCDVF